jgi:hypothetical protein
MTEIRKPKKKVKRDPPKSKQKTPSKPSTVRKRRVVTDEVSRHIERDGMAAVDDVGRTLAATKAAFASLDSLAATFIVHATSLANAVESSAEALGNARQCLSIMQQYQDTVLAVASGLSRSVIRLEFPTMLPLPFDDENIHDLA